MNLAVREIFAPSYQGLKEKDFNNALDTYLMTCVMDSEVYEQMNEEQKRIIQAIKKAFKRIKTN